MVQLTPGPDVTGAGLEGRGVEEDISYTSMAAMLG
jgi:hypothetical protein